MSQEVSTTGRTGRFSRINPERPERHNGYPVDNSTYSPSAFPENMTTTIAATTTTLGTSSTTLVRFVENRTFSCALVILNQANVNYVNRLSDAYLLASKDITNILTTVFKTSNLAASFSTIQLESITNQ
uniref:Uncharacterized protein n=1 Tax=Plectus sambesii TaxID=2011161 RepID=A0A914UUC1_9BILA